MSRSLAALFLVPAFLACSGSTPGDTPDAGTPEEDAATPTEDASAPPAPADGAVVADGGDAAVVALGSTKGSGGISCTSRGSLGGTRTFCNATIGGTDVKLAEPEGGSGPYKIVAYLHGDGAAAHNSGSAMRALLPWADKHHAIVLSVLSPNKCAWWQAPTQTDCSASATPVADTDGLNADSFKGVLDAVRSGYDVTLGNAFYYGSSGGSVFLTVSFFRKFGDTFPGIYALACGGEKPAKPVAWDTTDASKRAGTKLFFTYGDQDFLKGDIEVAIPYFSGLGFPTDTKVIAGAGHCEFDGHGRSVEIFEATVGK